ncbi:hypothetical protein C5167_021194 [Papaver somniferum]|uniref:Uncharacterized protein n=1 Tax=Papaver somniferum TaxID=3469 RepID=A0A4Y7IVP5_PAPSO|nr:hypothetical protein C5167_021194 [Papaver somniferum]
MFSLVGSCREKARNEDGRPLFENLFNGIVDTGHRGRLYGPSHQLIVVTLRDSQELTPPIPTPTPLCSSDDDSDDSWNGWLVAGTNTRIPKPVLRDGIQE